MAVASPLSVTHRRAQLSLRARVLSDLLRLWPALAWEDIDATFPVWATVVTDLIDRDRAASAALADDYYQRLRAVNGVGGQAHVVTPAPLPRPMIVTALRVTAANAVKAATAGGATRDAAMRNAYVRSSGAVTRLVLDAGRETVRRTALDDPAAEGWRRVTGGKACEFCTMLATRGGVYRSQASGGFAAHDHCGCTVEAVFRR